MRRLASRRVVLRSLAGLAASAVIAAGLTWAGIAAAQEEARPLPRFASLDSNEVNMRAGREGRPAAYSMMDATTPAPTVRPPSRMAKRSFSSMAIGTISVTSIEMLSPGITNSVPAGSVTTPVTSVVRK
jgi:hypothetical protein